MPRNANSVYTIGSSFVVAAWSPDSGTFDGLPRRSSVDASDLATACILSRFSDRSRIPVAYIVDRRWVAVLEAAELPNSIRLASLLPRNSERRPMPFVVIVNIFICIYQAGSDVNNKNNNRKLNYKHLIRCDTIRDAILTCARKPTSIGLIYRTETTTKNCKTEKLKSKNSLTVKSLGESCSQSWRRKRKAAVWRIWRKRRF